MGVCSRLCEWLAWPSPPAQLGGPCPSSTKLPSPASLVRLLCSSCPVPVRSEHSSSSAGWARPREERRRPSAWSMSRDAARTDRPSASTETRDAPWAGGAAIGAGSLGEGRVGHEPRSLGDGGRGWTTAPPACAGSLGDGG